MTTQPTTTYYSDAHRFAILQGTLTPPQRRVFDKLAEADYNRALTWLSEETGLPRPAVVAAITSLVRNGLVEAHGIGCNYAQKYRVVADRCEHGARDSLACPSCQVDRILGRVK